MTTLQPLGARLLVRKDASPERVGSIIVPEIARREQVTGEVLAVGGAVADLRPGQRITFGRYAGSRLRLDGEELWMLTREEVTGCLLDLGGAPLYPEHAA